MVACGPGSRAPGAEGGHGGRRGCSPCWRKPLWRPRQSGPSGSHLLCGSWAGASNKCAQCRSLTCRGTCTPGSSRRKQSRETEDKTSTGSDYNATSQRPLQGMTPFWKISSPFCPPRCCADSWGSADLCPFRSSPRTRDWTSGQSPHCHCSPPSASPALLDLCGGNHMCTIQWPLLSRSEPQHGSPLRW